MNPVEIEFLMRDNLTPGMDRARTSGEELEKGLDDVQTSAGLLDSRFKRIASVVGGAFAIERVVAFGKTIVDVHAEMQMLESSFEVLLNGKNVSGFLGELKQFAVESPLSLQGVSQTSQTLLGFGVAAEKVMPIIRQLGDVSMGDEDRFKSLGLAFAQMSATGKLMGQDLLQMINAGFNPLMTISEKTGKSIGDLKKDMESGAISSDTVSQAFADATAEGGKFHGMTQKQAEGIKGLQAQLEGGLQDAFNKIGASQDGMIAGGYKMAIGLVENYETIGKVLLGLVATYGSYRAAIIVLNAVEAIHTSIMMAQATSVTSLTAAEALQTVVTGKLAAMQALLNSTMLANPYVLATMAVVGLAATIWALHDSTTAQETAQKRLNEINDEAAKKKEDLTSKTSGLISTINSETKATLDKIIAYKELQGLFPEVLKNLDLQAFKSMSAAEQQKILNVEMEKMAQSDLSAQISQHEKLLESLKKQLETVKSTNTYMSQYGGGRDSGATEKHIKSEEIILEKLKQQNEELKQSAKEAEIRNLPEQDQIKWLKEQLAHLESQKQKIIDVANLAENLPAPFQNMALKARDALLEIAGINNQVSKLSGWLKSLTGEGSVKNKAFYEEQKKAADAALEAMDKSKKGSKEWNEQLKKLNEANANLKAWDFKDNSKASQTAAEKVTREVNALRDANEKVSTLKTKFSTEQQRLDQDLANEAKQAEISKMKDGLAKTLAQRDLDNKKELEAITREKEEKIKAYIQAQKELFDAQEDAKAKANKKYKKQTFDASSVDTSGIANQYAGIYEDTKTKQSREYLDLLLNNYKDYAQQRVDIEQKFNDDLAKLQAERQKAIEKGDLQTADALSRSIAKATADRGKALMSFDFERLKESPDYVRAFEDLKNTSSETLTSLLKQLEDAKATAAQVLNPQDLKDYTQAIQNIMDEMDVRNPFKALADRQKELADAEKALVEAKKQMDYVNAGGKIVTGSTSTKNADGSLNIINSYKSSAQALEEYNKAKDKATRATNNYYKAEAEAISVVSDLGNSLKNVGSTIGGTSGEILSFIGDIVSFASTSMSGIQKVSMATSAAVKAVETASVILAIISAAIQLMKKLDELIGDAHSQYEKYATKVAEINKLTDAVNEYRIAVLEANQEENSWFGEDKLQSLKDYKEVQQAALQSLIDKMTEVQAIYKNESGGGWLTTAGQLLWGPGVADTVLGTNLTGKKYQEGMTAAINNLRIETRKSSSGFLGSGIGGKSQKTEDLQTWINNNKDLFKGLETNLITSDGLLNSELVSTILDKYGDKLVGQTKETLEALKELQDKYDEYLGQLHEYVANLYEPLVDNFVSSLWDWFDSGKDALDSFKSYASDTFRDIVSDMLKTIVLDKVVGSFQDDIAALYDKYALGSISEEELMKQVAELTKKLLGNYETNIPAIEDMMALISSYFSQAGIDLSSSSSTSQSGKSGTGITATEEGVNRLEGLYTAMLENTIGLGDKVDNVVGLMNEALAVLAMIETNTGASADHLSGIKTAINQMRDDIAVLKRDGIKTL